MRRVLIGQVVLLEEKNREEDDKAAISLGLGFLQCSALNLL